MPVPKKRHTRSRQGSRRSHNFIAELPEITKCLSCGAPALTHNACPECGTYKGRQVLKIKPKKEKGKKE